MNNHPWRFCLAPMMDWSDRHCRYLWRLMSRHARLYTEMITTGAILHGEHARFLTYNPQEHPLALQLGGSNPQDLAQCARIAEDWGYDEVNLNCGCPSDRVQNGKIGACLMAEPELVAECVAAMRAAVGIPITVKHRIGIDDLDTDAHLQHFVATVAQAGCKVFIVHARKAWLQGLSPKQNREIPPLQYQRVYDLKVLRPDLTIVINGGIDSVAECLPHLQQLDGVMLGRAAYHNPYLLAEVDQTLFDESNPISDRDQILYAFADYCAEQLARGSQLKHLSRHILGLYAGQPGGRRFRRYISEQGQPPTTDEQLLIRAREQMNVRT